MGLFGKSKFEQMLDVLKEDRAQTALMTQAVLANQAAQTAMLKDYLKIFTEAPLPEVRIMQDVDELGVEERMKQKRMMEMGAASSTVKIDDQWMAAMAEVLAAEKREMG